jgi:Spy/CpxP family protein refolding chaperone
MKRMLLVPLVLVLACATNDYNDPQPDPRGGPRRGEGRMRMSGGGDDDLLPPSGWWHSPHIAETVNITAEQMQQLDKIEDEQRGEVEKLTRDLVVVSRDIRMAVNQKQATANDIVAAGERAATLRDDLFRRRIALLAAERAVLTYEQWTSLQSAIEERIERRRDDRGSRMGGGGRGRGGMGGRRPRW